MHRIAIAGLGHAAREIHLPAYARMPGLDVVAGCDPAARPGDFPFPLYGSIEEMVGKAGPDIVCVATPPHAHFSATRAALLAGCHVLCEKPFMPTLAEAEEICELSRRVGRWVVVNNQYRFMNIHRSAHEQVGTPGFGRLLFLSAEQTFYVTPQTEQGWRGQEARRTCTEFGIHVLDLCRYLFGEDPASVSARMPRGLDPNAPDYLNLIRLEFSGDRVAQITLDRLSRGPHRYLTLRLDGSEGIVETRLGGGMQIAAGVRGGSRKPFLAWDFSLGGRALLYHGERFRRIASDPLGVFAAATRRLMGEFLSALDTGGVPPCNAEDNIRSLQLVFAAYESHERGAPVQMAYRQAAPGALGPSGRAGP
jgi:predicted dehydrogenase